MSPELRAVKRLLISDVAPIAGFFAFIWLAVYNILAAMALIGAVLVLALVVLLVHNYRLYLKKERYYDGDRWPK